MKGKAALWLACALGALVALAVLGGSEPDSASQTETRMAEVLGAIAGAGKVEVALFYAQGENGGFGAAEAAVPTGAVVVAEGAGAMDVRLQLIRAARTLLGLPENAVDVFVMEENRR